MKKSSIFLLSCLAFILGIVAGMCLPVGPFASFLTLAVGAVVLALGWQSPKARAAGFCLLALAAGILRFQISIPSADEGKIWFYNGGEVRWRGIVSREPDVRDGYVNLTVSSGEIFRGGKWAAVSGRVLARADAYPRYDYGDELEISCRLEAPEEFDGFRYDEYLARYGIYSLCRYPKITLLSRHNGNPVYAGILAAKQRLKSVADRSLPEPEAGLFNGMFLGLGSGVSPEVKDSFSAAGLSHIIAISGSHIVVFAGLLSALSAGLLISRRRAFYPILAVLWLFVIMSGLSASAVRAGIMGSLVLLAQRIGRLNRSLPAVVFTAAAMILFNPLILKSDVGFQLSFLAVLGLIFLLPILEEWLKKIPNWRYFELRSCLTVTLAANLATVPLVAWQFNYFSAVSPLANLAAALALPFLMPVGFLAAPAGTLWLPLGKFFFFPAWLLLKYTIAVADFSARLPLAVWQGKDVPGWASALAYLSLALAVAAVFHRRKKALFKPLSDK